MEAYMKSMVRRASLPAFVLCVSAQVAGAATVTRVVPIVLDVTTDAARYTTELTLTNDTAAPVSVSALYTPSLGTRSGGGTVQETLGAGEQRRIPDVLSWLRAKGLDLPLASDDPSQGGTLKLDFVGPSAQPAHISALARTGSDTRLPQPAGRAGTAYTAFLLGEAASSAWVYAISNEVDRTNVAIVNASEAPVTFDVLVQDLSERGVLYYRVAQGVTLEAWGWMQLDSPTLLEANGSRAGRVTVTANGPIYVYAVINDRVTNDGSFVVADSPVHDGSDGFTIAVETAGFVTEATIFDSGAPRSLSAVDLSYTDALGPVPGEGADTVIPPPFSGVVFIPNVIDRLRASTGSTLGAAATGPYGGILKVKVPYSFGGGSLVRTVAPSPAGGRFGVHIPSISPSDAALDQASVYGLVADETNRSNVAVGSVEPFGPTWVRLRFTVHDGDAGGAVRGAPIDVDLLAGGWRQVNGILRTAGVRNGWVEVSRIAGSGFWFAYGVINDGANPGERTGDGAYIPMAK
jgi:hypothetical protein